METFRFKILLREKNIFGCFSDQKLSFFVRLFLILILIIYDVISAAILA